MGHPTLLFLCRDTVRTVLRVGSRLILLCPVLVYLLLRCFTDQRLEVGTDPVLSVLFRLLVTVQPSLMSFPVDQRNDYFETYPRKR